MVPPSATAPVAARETVVVSASSLIVVTAAVASTARFSKLPPDAEAMVTEALSPPA